MLSKVFCTSCRGIEAFGVTVEVDVSDGICFFLVGLPDIAIKESQQRITSALSKYGYRVPGKRIVINMAPANVRKEGSAFDVPIALGIVCATGQISRNKILQERLNEFVVMGELALDGSLRPVQGALPMALYAKDNGFKGCILPAVSALEAAEVDGITVFAADNFGDVIDILISPEEAIDKIVMCSNKQCDGFDFVNETNNNSDRRYEYDFADVKGQFAAKRGLEIAAAGGHNILMVGSPGCGKTLLARALRSILPPMSKREALETGKIYSIAGMFDAKNGLTRERPFRAPHHTSTVASLAGGGYSGMPGEISLAHNGVLFADEFSEFGRNVLEVLRQPLEDGFVTICRVRNKYTYPASFMLVAAMNPCPCGRFYDLPGKCACSSASIEKYMKRISGPLMDRMDIQLILKRLDNNDLVSDIRPENSACVAKRVLMARKIQLNRYRNENFYTNSRIPASRLQEFCIIGSEEKKYILKMLERLNISARGFGRIMKISRTIADLDEKEFISLKHISESLQFKVLDRSAEIY